MDQDYGNSWWLEIPDTFMRGYRAGADGALLQMLDILENNTKETAVFLVKGLIQNNRKEGLGHE